MCTAISFKTASHYFGRNLDLEKSYGERVVITPRKFPLVLRNSSPVLSHYAMIGMATVEDCFPLYYEATNEKGLSMAGLSFPDNAHYFPLSQGKENIAVFEFIPWILGKCESVAEAAQLIANANLTETDFSEKLPSSPLHWLISDSEKSITVECMKGGMKICENPFGILTNNPPFEYHCMNINNYMSLSPQLAKNNLTAETALHNYSLGMGALGLPGDYSSASRFVKAVFVKENSVCGIDENESVNQFFRILDSVAMPRGCVLTKSGELEYTRYSCCCNTDTGVYYYKTYSDTAVTAVEMRSANLDGNELIQNPLISC
ncbi:MAG: choloylglycine hydrolase [Clostridia bacterium]|nr:choloylglycine hydrolase [Clostridia bacterium]